MFPLHEFFNFSNPAFCTIVPTIGVAYVIQIVLSIPAVIYQEDRYYGTFLGSEREMEILIGS